MRLIRRGLSRGASQGRVWVSVALLGAIAAVALSLVSGTRLGQSSLAQIAFPPAAVSAAARARQVRAAFGQMPLFFEPNQGQTDGRVKFLARGNGYTLFLTGDEAVLKLRTGRSQDSNPSAAVVRMSLAGATPNPAVTGDGALPGKSNYLIGNRPSAWHPNIPQFARVRYHGIYPGVDLVYYGSQGRLEYDFEVAPNGDAGQVALRFPEPAKLQLQSNGDLLLSVAGGNVRLQAPNVYQVVGSETREVAGKFVLRAQNEVGFELGPYDRSRALIIDPVLSYSSYLGGSGDEACSAAGINGAVTPGCPAIAVDTALNVYVAGSTTSADFPVVPVDTCPPTNTPAAFQCANAGGADVFVTKFSPSTSSPPYTITFSTYLGGDGNDTSAGVAVDSGFNVDVAGTTASTNFPTLNGFQTTPPSADNHAFLSQLTPDGSALLYSTYLGGTGTDNATGLAVDFRSKLYVVGTTNSGDFPTTNGAFQVTPKATNQYFLSKLDPLLIGTPSLVYSTYIGGSLAASVDGVTAGGGIAVDTVTPNPNVYVTGGTDFSDLTTLNATQLYTAGLDVWAAKFDLTAATGAQLKYLTYLGGTGDEIGYGITADSTGNAYIAGSTTSTDFAFTPGTGVETFQAALSCPGVTPPAPCPLPDAFLAKLGVPCTGTGCSTTNVPLNYFTYLGGSGSDVGLGVAADTIQGARITGTTDSTDLPFLNAFQSTLGGGVDAFVARIDTLATTATAPGHSLSYLGGSGNDAGTSITTDAATGTVSQGAAYVAGETFSGDFPTLSPVQGSLNGASDAFVTKVGPFVNLMFSPAPTATPNPLGFGNQVTFKYTIVNNGDQVNNVTFSSAVPAGSTFVSANLGTGTNTCTGGSTGTVVCNIGSMNSAGTATANVIVIPTPPTTPNTAPTSLPDSAQVSVAGGNPVTASVTATVNDFTLNNPPPAPASATVVAGQFATYTVTVTPTGPIPSSVTMSCSSGLPTGAACSFTTPTIPNLSNGSAVSDTLNISTTMRTTTTVDLWHGGGPLYATWLPVSGLALLGLGVGGTISRKRRVLAGLFLAALLTLAGLQAGCGSSSGGGTTVTGTPVGTYTITISATSGATRTSSVILTVQ